MPKLGLLCDAGADAASLSKDLQSAIDKMGQTPVRVKVLTQGTLVTLLVGPEQPGVGGQMNLSTDAKFKRPDDAVQPHPAAAMYVSPSGIIDLINQIPAKVPPINSQKRGS